MHKAIVFTCVCTQRTVNEFMLMKTSLELFQPCEWIVATDFFSAERLSFCPNIRTIPIIDCSDGHHLKLEKQDNFLRIVSHKITVCMESIRQNGYAFLLDCDLLFLYSVQSIFNEFLSSHYDVMVSDQTGHFSILKVKTLDYVGKYNSGMVLVRNMKFVEDWGKIINERKYFVDQKPLEIVLNTGQYQYTVFPDTCNIGAWKYPLINRIDSHDDGLYLEKKPIINFHLHLLSDTPIWHKVENSFRSKVIGLISQIKNNPYSFLLNYLLKQWFNSCNSPSYGSVIKEAPPANNSRS